MKKITLLLLTAALLPLPSGVVGQTREGIGQQILQAVKEKKDLSNKNAQKLIDAIRQGHTQEALKLIPQSNINFVNTYTYDDGEDILVGRETPLLQAIWAKNKEVVAALLKDKRIDVNMDGKDAGAPLFYAIRGNKQIALMLLARPDVKLDVRYNEYEFDGSAPIHWAARDHEILSALVKNKNFKKEMVNMRDRRGATPLHRCGNKQAAELLIKNGADVNARDEYGFTPLFSASPEVMELLIANGADVNVRTKDGETLGYSLVHSFDDEQNCAALDILLRHGANVNLMNKSTDRALLHVMAEDGRLGMLKRLLEAKQKGADIDFNVRNTRNETPLHKAIERRQIDAARFLINEAHVKTNIKSNDGQTAEDLAKNNGSWDLIFKPVKTAGTLTVDNTPLPPVKAGNGKNTALMDAVINLQADKAFDEVKQMLAISRRDINAQSPYGYTALDYALAFENIVPNLFTGDKHQMAKERKKVSDLLKLHGAKTSLELAKEKRKITSAQLTALRKMSKEGITPLFYEAIDESRLYVERTTWYIKDTAENYQKDVLEMQKRGIDINTCGGSLGATALDYALICQETLDRDKTHKGQVDARVALIAGFRNAGIKTALEIAQEL